MTLLYTLINLSIYIILICIIIRGIAELKKLSKDLKIEREITIRLKELRTKYYAEEISKEELEEQIIEVFKLREVK